MDHRPIAPSTVSSRDSLATTEVVDGIDRERCPDRQEEPSEEASVSDPWIGKEVGQGKPEAEQRRDQEHEPEYSVYKLVATLALRITHGVFAFGLTSGT